MYGQKFVQSHVKIVATSNSHKLDLPMIFFFPSHHLFTVTYFIWIKKVGMIIYRQHIQSIPSTVFGYNQQNESASVFLCIMEPMALAGTCPLDFLKVGGSLLHKVLKSQYINLEYKIIEDDTKTYELTIKKQMP